MTNDHDLGFEASVKLEQWTAMEQEALRFAAEYDEKGWTFAATLARRRARGYKSARNRLARRMGWMS
jgi:hypothetical protein